jgi:hypothetical protein
VSGRGRPGEHRAQGRLPGLALTLAVVAVLFAGLGALLPAEHQRATYSWPPRTLPRAQPNRAWYTPLLLARHQPQSIAARLPCALPRPLPRAELPVVVLSTARDAVSAGGLQVAQVGRELVVSSGGATVTRLALTDRAAAGCAYRLTVSGGRWSVEGGPQGQTEGGSVEMPIVSGLFSGLDLRQGSAPSIAVTTTTYGSRSTIAQTVLRALAALAALAALILVAQPRRPRPTAGFVRRTVTRVGLVDAIVVLVLLGWWIVGPAFYDDGWVTAGQKNFAVTGGPTSYYDSFAVTSSLQYWLVWVEHWLFDSSNALLVLRIPALVCLAATWVLCRWIFGRLTTTAGRAGRWALASAFLTGALAWGMTLRPEPVVALLVTSVVACMVLFVERGTTAPLAGAAVLIALAVSAHPAGLVTLAPVVVALPAVVRWARPRAAVAGTIVLAGAALLGILALLGSDLEHLRASAASLRAFGVETAGWRDELTRYSLLSRDLYGAPLRRLWVVLALLAVFAYLLRGRRERESSTLDLPAAAVGVALLLLIVTPSKLPWHFGVLIGLAAVALAAETERLVAESRGWHVRPFVVLGATTVAAAWSWSPRLTWSDLDLRTLHWTLGVERHLTLAKAAGAAPVLLLVALVLIVLARQGARRLDGVPWRAAAWAVPVVSIPLIAFTIAVFVADAAKTSSWTLTRQNFDTLRGDLRCGLANDSLVPVLSSMSALPPLGPIGKPPPWLPTSPVAGLPRFALTPQGRSRPARSPWFRLIPGRRIGFFLTGIPDSSETIELEWGLAGGAKATVLQAGQVVADLASDARPELGYWRFSAGSSLPPAPAGVNALRFSVRTAGAPAAGMGFTSPVTYADETLARTLERAEPALALPNLLPYFPCTRLPAVSRGVADVPKLIVAFRDTTWPLGSGTSPFDEQPDLYPFVRLPLSDSADPPDDVAVYVVDTRIDGAALAPAVASG